MAQLLVVFLLCCLSPELCDVLEPTSLQLLPAHKTLIFVFFDPSTSLMHPLVHSHTTLCHLALTISAIYRPLNACGDQLPTAQISTGKRVERPQNSSEQIKFWAHALCMSPACLEFVGLAEDRMLLQTLCKQSAPLSQKRLWSTLFNSTSI